MRLGRSSRKKPDIVQKWQDENLKSKDRLDKIANTLDLNLVMNVLLANGANIGIHKLFNYAIPAIYIDINNQTVLSLSFQRNGSITANMHKGFENLDIFYKRFKPSIISGMFELKDDNELEKFINLFAEHLNIELLEED